MKNLSLILASLALPLTAATTYNDSPLDVAVPGNPYPHIDITSVDVSNTSTVLSFKINLNGDPIATNWGKYMVGISTGAGGDTAGNGWGRPISMSDGMEHWMGSWVDAGNQLELYDYTGSWTIDSDTHTGPNPANLSISTDSSSVTLDVDLAALGLNINDVIHFDVYASGGGGGDGAVDSLAAATASINNWGDSFNTDANGGSPNPALAYTVVPEPTSLLLGALGLLGLLRRRR